MDYRGGEILTKITCPVCGNEFDLGLMTMLGADMPLGCVVCATAFLNVKAGKDAEAPSPDAGVNERIDQVIEVVLAVAMAKNSVSTK
jgi:hypothetical protein